VFAGLSTPRPKGSRVIDDNGAMLRQRTLTSMTRAVGVGVHGGQKVELTLRPAPPDSGIVFRRVDLPRSVDIKADAFSVCDTRMATTVSAGGDPDGTGRAPCGWDRLRSGFTEYRPAKTRCGGSERS